MQVSSYPVKIAVTVQIVEGITLSVREASFLRTMAQFAQKEGMRGSAAAKRLDAILVAAGIPPDDGKPVYDLFE